MSLCVFLLHKIQALKRNQRREIRHIDLGQRLETHATDLGFSCERDIPLSWLEEIVSNLV